jgi:nucleotide-binding universal stress UspA family protein
MNILVAADGSSYTKRMLAYLAAHDEWLGPHHRYTVMTVVTALPVRAVAALDRESVQRYYDDETEKVFKPIRAFFARQGIVASFVRKIGSPAELIARQATAGKFDLLLMGSHGHGELTSLVMGSVATKVLARCKTPLLLVR